VPEDIPVEGSAGRVSQSAQDQDAWVRYEAWWHFAFGVLTALALILLAVEESPASRRLLAACLVVALAGWYVGVGKAQINRSDPRRGMVAAVGTIVLQLAAFAAEPGTGVLLFIVYAQLFAYLEQVRYTVPAVATLSLGVALLSAADAGWTWDATLAALGGGAVSLIFAISFGLWISRIIEQSRDRAKLINDLQQARAELDTAHRDAGAAAERRRLALEIHDTLAQGFTSIVMLVQAAEVQAGRSEEELRRHLALIERTARENLDEARSLVAALAPVPLQAAPLAEALTRLTENFSDETGVPARLSVTGTPRPLDGNTEVVLLRVAQEALNNVRRHAAASHVDVELSYVDVSVGVQIRDDGCGFAPAATSGFGLRGMRSRVEQVGGDVLVETAPGKGTRVGVTLR